MSARRSFFIFLILLFLATSASGTPLLTKQLGCESIIPQNKTGYYAYFNPSTNRLTSAVSEKRPGLKLTAEQLYPFSTFHEGLTTEKTSDNVTRLDIKGRFQQGSVAVVDRYGKTHIIRIGGEIFLSEAGRCMRAAIIDRYRQGKIGRQQ